MKTSCAFDACCRSDSVESCRNSSSVAVVVRLVAVALVVLDGSALRRRGVASQGHSALHRLLVVAEIFLLTHLSCQDDIEVPVFYTLS